MPFYYRRNYYSYNKWRRRRPRNWFRRPFRRRFWRRKRRRVRNNRKPIPLVQWQPPYIKNCKIKGKTALILFSPRRIGHNSTMYEESITPSHWPGGGSFSVTQFTLNALYDIHSKCRNWWTGSNVDLPLCKYAGVYLKFYQCEYTDYIVRVQTQLPSASNKLTYPSCQPNMMFMAPGKMIIPSRKTQKRKKPYKKIFIKPPPQLENKWYFQLDMHKTPLLTIHCTACSLQNYFLKPNTESTTITFTVLNTTLIQNRQMAVETNTSWYYKKLGNVPQYMYYTDQEETDSNNITIGHLIPLTNPRNNTPGKTYMELYHQYNKENYKNYLENYKQYWGNPFNIHILQEQEHIYISTRSPENIAQDIKSKGYEKDYKWSELTTGTLTPTLTKLQESIFYEIQYNPQKDTGQDTLIYLLPNYSGDGWDPPSKPEIIIDGFPMWLGLFGYLDFQKNLKVLTNIDTSQILVIKSNYTHTPHPSAIVPINYSFTQGHSPYEDKALIPDSVKWYPQVQYQEMELNKILTSGPGTPYIEDSFSENITMYYNFKWKWGGSPPKSVTIDNPSHQITYPVPCNQYETTSLQSPAQAPESILYSFDQRHGMFTKSAIERITKDWSTEPIITSITDPALQLQLRETMQQLQTTEEKELQKEEEIRHQLIQLRQHQQSLRERIIQILTTKTQ
nr:MAG: ORF1 [TTV-like mini virus]